MMSGTMEYTGTQKRDRRAALIAYLASKCRLMFRRYLHTPFRVVTGMGCIAHDSTYSLHTD